MKSRVVSDGCALCSAPIRDHLTGTTGHLLTLGVDDLPADNAMRVLDRGDQAIGVLSEQLDAARAELDRARAQVCIRCGPVLLPPQPTQPAAVQAIP